MSKKSGNLEKKMNTQKCLDAVIKYMYGC